MSVFTRTDELAISTVTYAEPASGARTREYVDEQLSIFRRVPLDTESAWRAGVVFRQYRPAKGEHEPVLAQHFNSTAASFGFSLRDSTGKVLGEV